MHRNFNIFAFFLCTICAISLPEESFGQSKKPPAVRKPKSTGKAETQPVSASIEVYESKNFRLQTDLSAAAANELLERLEKMIELVSRYYGQPNSQTIEMSVVDSRENWPVGSIPPEALPSIESGAGITLNATAFLQNALGEKQITRVKSVVWAVAERGVPQHEAVHAFCHQNFGRTGPTWYSEGMAELGKYWRDQNKGVQIDDEVMRYLQRTEPQSLDDITHSKHKTGDSWQNYAWRWVLCHLLSTNPNYAPRFKPLGLALLGGQPTQFDDVYGSMSKEISFEYLLFLKQIDQGYRCDLCAWDWKTKPMRLKGTSTTQVKVIANRGWQAAKVQLKQGDRVSFVATGDWSLQPNGPKIGPEGDEQQQGRLVGILFDDYELFEPFDLGKNGEYEAVRDGVLFVRCQDDWCQLADNSGTVTVKFQAVKPQPAKSK